MAAIRQKNPRHLRNAERSLEGEPPVRRYFFMAVLWTILSVSIKKSFWSAGNLIRAPSNLPKGWKKLGDRRISPPLRRSDANWQMVLLEG